MIHNFKKYLLFIILFAITFSVNAQQGWWTWMKGAYPGAAVPNWGTQGVAALANEPPGDYQTATCWVDSQGNLWQFGGGNGWGWASLWKYNPVTNMWTWVKGPNTSPTTNLGVWGTQGVPNAANNPPALTTGAASWVDANDNLWLFGGFGWGTPAGAFRGYMGAMWKYDPVTNMWTWMNGPSQSDQPGVYGALGVPAAANYPPPRVECNASWVDNAGNFWLFGGGARLGTMNDMWRYNPTTNQWTWMKGPNTAGGAGTYGTKGVAAAGNVPPSRWVHSRWKDLNGNFWLFGGTHTSNTQSMNDLWKFDPITNNWTWMSGSNLFDNYPALPAKCVPSTTVYPQARYENNANWVDRCGNLWMFGGKWTSGGTDKNDLWCYKITTNEWVLVGGNAAAVGGTKGVPAGANLPPTIIGCSSWTRNNEFWMFGGRTAGSVASNTLWKYIPDSTCAQSTCWPPSTNPTANFTANNLIACDSLTVTFTNTSTNSNAWTWNFGDGSPTSNVQNPTHTYPSPGQYTVSLIATDGTTSDTTTFVNYVTVIPSAIASFTPSNDTVCVGQNVVFTNTSTNAISYSWSIPNLIKGDTTTNLNYTFNTAGVYSVILTANGNSNCNGIDSINIYVINGGSSTQNVSMCSGNTYTLPGGAIVSAAGTYNDTLSFGPCDSIVTTIITLLPASTSTANPTICNGNSYTLPGGNVVTVAGTYSDTLLSYTGCDSIITTNLTLVSSFTFSQSPVICNGDLYNLPDGSSTGVAGTYVDTIPSVGGCDSIITTTLSVIAPATSSQTPVLCQGQNYTLPGGAVVSTNGTYLDTLTGSNGCDSIITTTLTFNPNSASAASPVICSNQTYTLPSGNIVSASGTYSDTLTSSNGCDSIITTTLTVNPIPTISLSPDITIITGDSTVLVASGGGTYSWSPSTGLNVTSGDSVIAKPNQTTTYCVVVTNSNGCIDSTCVTVTVELPCAKEENLGIPNAFSPNGDGINDDFCLQGWHDCNEMFNIKIYNRWGEKVFESNDPDFCWDGTWLSKEMPARPTGGDAQVFVYQIRAVFLDQKKLILRKGNISLIR